MEWKEFRTRYTAGKQIRLGHWPVAQVWMSGMMSKDDPNKYACSCSLPGIKPDLGNFPDEQSAMQIAEKAVRHWLSKAALPTPPEDE